MREIFGSYRVGIETVIIVALLVGLRAALWSLGVVGMSTSPLTSSIGAGGVFVMGLVAAGTLSDYRDAERAPTDLAAGLYAILREAEGTHKVWGRPDLRALRERLIAVVTTLRSDINVGNARDCQAAIEDVSESLMETENSDVPANYIVRLRAEQAGLRKSLLRVYHIQREQFLPSAKAMIMSIVVVILTMLLLTDMGGLVESLVTRGTVGRGRARAGSTAGTGGRATGSGGTGGRDDSREHGPVWQLRQGSGRERLCRDCRRRA